MGLFLNNRKNTPVPALLLAKARAFGRLLLPVSITYTFKSFLKSFMHFNGTNLNTLVGIVDFDASVIEAPT